MDELKVKQQIVEKIQESSTILITVSDSPSVDALSAAIGLTLMLDTMEKHATAVFSGTVPPAIAFLEPEKILDDTTDSLRDFIIALDKEKADHLRYKVEGDSVKIFITPYKTTITADDLEFSQGDYNVELVIALGVDNQDHLDGALAAHGQILHDATVITLTAGEQTSTLGGIDWHDDNVSSLSEMIAGLAEALKTDKKKPLLDAQSATALLTGIVAQTDRFSNEHTTAKVMTVASQLMAAGADQQLIATKLNEGGQADEVEDDSPDEPAANGGLKVERDETPKEEVPKDTTSLNIHHEPFETLEEMDKRVKAAEQAEAAKKAAESLDHTANAVAAGRYALEEETPQIEEPVQPLADDGAPQLGGTLNATTEQAAEDARRAAENDQNKTILSHSYIQTPPAGEPTTPDPFELPSNAPAQNSFVLGGDGVPGLAPLDQSSETLPKPEPLFPVINPPSEPAPAPGPQDLGLPMPPPLPGDTAAPFATGPYAPPADPGLQPERLGDILAPEPTAPQPPSPLIPPTDPTVPPLPPVAPPEGPYAPPADDPGQFKIPGQPGQP